MTARQRQKLYLHERGNHVYFPQLNQWICDSLLDCSPCLAADLECTICNLGKAHRLSHKSDTGRIDQDHKAPGDGVSSDQMKAGAPGHVMTSKGSPTNRHYLYANFWVDHFSRFVCVTFHSSTEAAEIVNSTEEFEALAARYNVNIKSLCADNGVYASNLFRVSCEQKNQKLTSCAVGHHSSTWHGSMV